MPTTHAFASIGGTGTPGDFDQLGDVFFTGAEAMAVFGGPVPVYSPDTWSGGSSLSHLGESSIDPNPLMSPFVSLGEMNRTLTELELAVLKDMGYDVVPEPITLSMLALGAVALIKRRK